MTALDSEQLFHGFLEAAPDPVVIIDASGVIIKVNSQTEQVFGYAQAELLGSPVEVLMPQRYRGSHVEESRAFFANPQTRQMGRGLDLFGLRKNGEEFPIDVSISVLPTEAGDIAASTIRDVSAHRRLEDELRRRTRELQETDRHKDEFLSAVAHELRTPLGVLLMVGHILRLPQADAATREKALGRLDRQIAHMTRLVEDLLDLARVRSSKVTLRRQAVDLEALLTDAVEMSQPLVESRKHHLEFACPAERVWVDGDPARLLQMVTNLLNNAAKYTPEGGKIRLSMTREGEWAAIRVRDNGVGIPKEMLPRVFDRFVQVEPGGHASIGGLGIGLAVVRHLVALHGGTVGVDSDGAGKGSEFILRLPLMPNPEGEKEATVSERGTRAVSPLRAG